MSNFNKNNLLRFLKKKIKEGNKINDLNKIAKENGKDIPYPIYIYPTSNIIEQFRTYDKIKNLNYENYLLIKKSCSYSIYMVALFNDYNIDSANLIYYILPIFKNNIYIPQIINPKIFNNEPLYFI